MRNKFFSYFISFLYLFSGTSLLFPSLVRSSVNQNIKNIPSDYIKRVPKDDYILGPGDTININVSDEYPELQVERTIDGQGTIYLPRLKRIFVGGLTINELNQLLNNAFKEFIKFPSVEVSIKKYRMLRITVRGEVNDPGMHKLEGSFTSSEDLKREASKDIYFFPTLFDAIRKSGGITEFSDLSNINIIRKSTISEGGGKKSTNVNFISIFDSGDTSQNIRIYDSDIITVNKLQNKQITNLRKAISSNLNPRFIKVLVLGELKLLEQLNYQNLVY